MGDLTQRQRRIDDGAPSMDTSARELALQEGYPKRLPEAALPLLRAEYRTLYLDAFPNAGDIPLGRIEVADFGLSDTVEGFREAGLGLWTTELCGQGQYTQKVLINLPGQLLPPHAHKSVLVMKPELAEVFREHGFVDIRTNVSNFEGIVRYKPDGSIDRAEDGSANYDYKAGDFEFLQPSIRNWRPVVEALGVDNSSFTVLPGKIETFRPVSGWGILFCNRDEVELLCPTKDELGILPACEGLDIKCTEDLWRVPASMAQLAERARTEYCVSATDALILTGGVIVRLFEDAQHAFLAGPMGAVYEETSMSSRDCADAFRDPRIVR